MEHRVFILAFAALVLVPFYKGEEWEPPGSCQGCYYPEFTLVKKDGDFEERQYNKSRWVTTNIADASLSELMAAKNRLTEYCSEVTDDCESVKNSWPAVITVTEGEDGSKSMSASWFVPPHVNLKVENNNDNSEVKQEIRPLTTVYVMGFYGLPSESLFQDHTNQLRDYLEKAGKSYEAHKYTGAAYNKYFSFVHYDEIWISATT